jgi:hypothetical protein
MGKTRGECTSYAFRLNTHRFVPKLYKCITTRFALEKASFVKEEVQFRDLAVFGEDLYKRVPKAISAERLRACDM